MDLSKIKAMKVVELKNELESRGLPKSGTKAVLVDRLYQALQENAEEIKTEEVTAGEDELEEWEENLEGLENIVDTGSGDLNTTDLEEPETKTIEQAEATEAEESSSKEMVDEANPSGHSETEHAGEETSAEDAPQIVTDDVAEPQDTVVDQAEINTNAAKAADIATKVVSAEDSLVSDVDPAKVQDNQNFDVAETKEDSKTRSVDVKEQDDTLFNDETGGDELDYGDGDDNKDELISFQIEESEIAIVETGNKEEEEQPTSDETKVSEAQGDSTKKEEKPSDEKEEEGHPDIMKMIWVSNLTKQTRALDLKTCFGLYGKVMSAKVVMNPNAKEAKCFGLVTMSQESEAEVAIQKLNGYKLHNKDIVTSRPKKDNAVLRKMRTQQLKPSSRPAGIRPRQTSPEDKSKSSSRSDKERSDRDRRVVSGSGTISVNIKSDDKARPSDRRRRTRSPSTSRKGAASSNRSSPSRKSDRPRSPRRRRSRSPKRKSRSPRRKSRSPRRRSSPARRRSRSPRRKSRSPVKPPAATERTVRRTSPRARSPRRPSVARRSPPHRRPSSPRRSPPSRHSAGSRRSPRRPDRRRSSRSPKRARRSNSRERRRPRSRSTERKVTAGTTANDSELRLLREQTAKQEAAIKALMQGNVQNLGGLLGESLTEKLAADLKSALVKQLQNTVKTMSSKATNKAALFEAQNASNAAKIKENLEKMKANGQITNLITNQPRPAAPVLAPPPMQSLPKYSPTPTLPSFNPLMVSHKQPPSAPVQEYSSQRSSPRDSYSRSSHDRSRPSHSSSSHGGSSHPSSSHGAPSHMGTSHSSSYGSSSHGSSHSSNHGSSHSGHGSSHGHSSSSHISSREGYSSSSYNSSSSSSRPSRSDTYSSARSETRPSSGQQSNQINDLLKSLQGVKEMVNTKPSTYGNVQQPPPQVPGPSTYQKVQQQVQNYKSSPMMQPPPIPFNQPPPAQPFNNVPAPINFTQPNGPPLQWAPPPFQTSTPPYLNNPNNQFRR
ncbi:hypothetical protein ACHWQZ_G011213 [Mnemiopsis leidyi]